MILSLSLMLGLANAAPTAPSSADIPSLHTLLKPDSALARSESSPIEKQAWFDQDALGIVGPKFQRYSFHFDSTWRSPTGDSALFQARSKSEGQICHIEGSASLSNLESLPNGSKKSKEQLFRVTMSLKGRVSGCAKGGEVLGTLTAFAAKLPDGRKTIAMSRGLDWMNPYPANVKNRLYGNQFEGIWIGSAGDTTVGLKWGMDKIPASDRLDCGNTYFMPCGKNPDPAWKTWLTKHRCFSGDLDPEVCDAAFLQEDWWKPVASNAPDTAE